MIENYNWTRDGEIVQGVINKIWIPLVRKYGMKSVHNSIESNKLHTFKFSKNDLLIKIMMSRTAPLNCYFFSVSKSCEDDFLSSLFKPFIPANKDFYWLYLQNNLPDPEKSEDKETRWTQWMNNYVFLLEKYCSELLETGDICGWLAKYQPNT